MRGLDRPLHSRGPRAGGIKPALPHLALQMLLFGATSVVLVERSARLFNRGLPSATVSFSNYVDCLSDAVFWAALARSMAMAGAAAAISTLLAMSVTLWIWKTKAFAVHLAVCSLFACAFVTGTVIRTHSLATLLAGSGPLASLWRVMPAYSGGLLYMSIGTFVGLVAVTVPFGFAVCYAARRELPNELLDAARDMGAEQAHVEMWVELPLMRPGLTVCLVLTFLLALGDVLACDIIGGTSPYTTPQYILDHVKADDWGHASAAAVISASLALGSLALFSFAMTDRSDSI